eukprot:6203928-Pleurochrysis_carterae.AAC.2
MSGRERGVDELWQVVGRRRDHAVRVGGDVDVEKVGYRTFDVPSRGQVRGEGRVERVGRVFGVQDEEVVDVATQNGGLGGSVDRLAADKDAVI